MSEELKIVLVGTPTDEAQVIPFPVHRTQRALQSLTEDQMTRLIWLLTQTEKLDRLLNVDMPKIAHECPVAKAVLS